MKLFLIVFLSLVTGFANSQINAYNVGDTVTDQYLVVDTQGNYHYLQDYISQQKIIVLFFFNIYGQLHETIAPIMQEFYTKYGCNQGEVVILGVDYSSNASDPEVQEFINTFLDSTNNLPCSSGNDGYGNTMGAGFDVQYSPTVCLISSDGVMRNTDMWPINNLVEFESYFVAQNISIFPMSCVESVESLSVNSNVHVSPNPSNGEFTFFLGTEFSKAELSVYDMLGKCVLNKFELLSKETTIKLNQPSGLYLLELTVDGHKTTQRIIVE